MSAKNYYYEHFSELTPEKQFHFATRMKNYFKTHDFDDFLANNKPSSDLSPIFQNNDYSRVNNYQARRPFFEKYAGLYGIEAALFRVHHLLKEYDTDIRDHFTSLYSLDRLYSITDELLSDGAAIETLSTWAINTIYLTEELFPRSRNVVKELSEWTLMRDPDELDPTLFVYLCTHIVLCESQFYTKNLNNSNNTVLLKKLLEESAGVIEKHIDTISLDAAVEFLVCCNMVGVQFPRQRDAIKAICDEYKKDNDYLINYRRDKTPGSYFHTLNGAEHINVLYIMSGLDSE
jgi:hypothetical protein